MRRGHLLFFFYLLFLLQNAALANDVRVDIQCDHEASCIQIRQYVTSEIKKSKDYKQITSDSGDLHIRIILASIPRPDKPKEIAGFALAYLSTAKSTAGYHVITDFWNSIVPTSGIQKSIQYAVQQSLGKHK